MLITDIVELNVSNGYIAGNSAGIVTVNAKATARHIHLLDAQTLQYLQHIVSLNNGHYLFMGLDPNKQYLVMCRDLPPNGVDQRYEPFCWDYVTPATDLTIAEQQELWQSWHESR